MKRHAKDKKGNADTHCDEPSVRLCIHGLHHQQTYETQHTDTRLDFNL
jgi:hypothetical protein